MRLIWLLFLPVFAQAQVAFVSADSDIDIGETYTAAAGTDRVVVYSPHAFNALTLIDLQSAVFGAVNMNIRGESRSDLGTTNGRSVAFMDVLEASLPEGANALTPTYDNAPANDEGAAFTLSGVNQSSPVSATDVEQVAGSQTACALSVAVTDGSMVVVSAGSNQDITLPAGYTSIRTDTATPDIVVGYKAITAGGTESPSFSIASGTIGCVAVVYAPVDSSVATNRRRNM